MNEILLFNKITCLILSNIVSNFLERNNARFLVLSFFLIYPSTLLKIIHKGFSLYAILYAVS